MNDLPRSLRSAAIAATVTCVLSACALPAGGADPATSDTVSTLFPTGAEWGDGWSYVERSDVTSFRWMSARGEVRLARAHRWSTMRLFVDFVVPFEILRRPPQIRILLDGRELDHFQARSGIEQRAYLVPASAASGAAPALVIETSETTVIGGRTLGVALERANWDAVGGDP